MEGRGIHWNSWDSLSKAKSEGGIGFQNFRALNEALLAHQAWRLLVNNQSYWAKILKGLYFPNSSFLRATRGDRASWAWMRILQGRDLLVKGLRWQVQDGSCIDFWEVKWTPSLPSFRVSTPRPLGRDVNRVADVIDQRKGTWRKQLFSKEEVKAIGSIPISKFKRKELLVWHYSSNGAYSVKSGYHLTLQEHLSKQEQKASSSFSPNKKLWSTIWKLKVPNKIRNFWWRTC